MMTILDFPFLLCIYPKPPCSLTSGFCIFCSLCLEQINLYSFLFVHSSFRYQLNLTFAERLILESLYLLG